MLLMCPTGVWAAGSGETTTQVPVWLCIPFAGLLLCIAVMPLIKAEWWEAHQPHVVLMWILLMVIPFAVVYGTGKATETVLECIVNDYLTFIVLLFGLFCVSGNITMEGDFAGSPRVNACLLAFGTLLSSCIGTTGASMLMVRPVIKMNQPLLHQKVPYRNCHSASNQMRRLHHPRIWKCICHTFHLQLHSLRLRRHYNTHHVLQ